MAMLWWRSGRLGDAPWPGTDALYWAEIELRAPPTAGDCHACRCASTRRELDEPHQDASSPFNVSVVARPEHTLTVTVASGGVPIEEAYIRLGPYRATTDASGQAAIKSGQGPLRACGLEGGIRHRPPMPLAIDADASVADRGAGVAAGRSRRGLDGVSAVI